MPKENRNSKIQVRITPTERAMLDELAANSKSFSISKLVREAISEKYKEAKTQ